MGGFLNIEFSMAEVAQKHFVPSSVGLLDRDIDGVSGDSPSWDSLLCLYLLPSICEPRLDDEFIMILWDGKEQIQKECNKKKHKYRWEPPYLLHFAFIAPSHSILDWRNVELLQESRHTQRDMETPRQRGKCSAGNCLLQWLLLMECKTSISLSWKIKKKPDFQGQSAHQIFHLNIIRYSMLKAELHISSRVLIPQVQLREIHLLCIRGQDK